MNWIINNTFVLNIQLLTKYGFKNDDKVMIVHSREDNCFYIRKHSLGDNKITKNDRNSFRTRNKYVAQKLGCKDNERLYFDIVQDKYDKNNNAVKCIVRYEHEENIRL